MTAGNDRRARKEKKKPGADPVISQGIRSESRKRSKMKTSHVMFNLTSQSSQPTSSGHRFCSLKSEHFLQHLSNRLLALVLTANDMHLHRQKTPRHQFRFTQPLLILLR